MKYVKTLHSPYRSIVSVGARISTKAHTGLTKKTFGLIFTAVLGIIQKTFVSMLTAVMGVIQNIFAVLTEQY